MLIVSYLRLQVEKFYQMKLAEVKAESDSLSRLMDAKVMIVSWGRQHGVRDHWGLLILFASV